MNRAARLESLTKELGEPLLMTSAVATRLERPVRLLGSYRLRDLLEPIEVYGLEPGIVPAQA